MADWKLSRKEAACTRCKRAFEEDEPHYSVLRVTGRLDDALFGLWQTGLCEERDIIMRCNQPGDLATRIKRAKRALGEEVEEDEDDFDDEE